MSTTAYDLASLPAQMEAPVLIVSTVAGRGMYSLGEAFQERLTSLGVVGHVAVESYLPANSVSQDLDRYKLISNRMPSLLYLVNKIPIFYYRKYFRESLTGWSDLRALKALVEALNPRTILCVSHRPAFWVSTLKKRERMSFKLWGVLGEYGNTIGWRYIFWDEVDAFLSPLGRRELTYPFPDSLRFLQIDLPARQAYYRVAERPGDPHAILLVCGYWGQGPLVRVVRTILAEEPHLHVTVVCGENSAAASQARMAFGSCPNIEVHGVVDSLLPFLTRCACIVTKPGISTLLEAHVARRKIFLLKGMPVAEDNNARYAVRHFGAEWFTRDNFRAWRRSLDVL
jgi:UDP-N-acetylglucosamine:LPS N-acetylglucosamine transferase